MTIWLGITVWLGALVFVLILAGGVRRGDNLRDGALGPRPDTGHAEGEERFVSPLSATRRTPAPTRRATG
jgi:hypothetical protein